MKTCVAILLIAAGALGSTDVQAQTAPQPNGFVTVIGGTQTIPAVTSASTFTLFGRAGTVETVRRRTTASLVDVTAAHRVWRQLAIGFGALRMSKKEPMSYVARVPLENSFQISPGSSIDVFPTGETLADVPRDETQLHVSILWIAPLNDKVSIDFSGGPSLVRVKQDNLIAMRMPRPLAPEKVIASDRDSAAGYHAGFGLRGLLIKHAGLALRVQYTKATADLSIGKQKVGGLQIGAGLGIVY